VEQASTAGGAPPGRVDSLGKEADRLVELFNAGLHAKPTKQGVELAFRDLMLWLAAVISIKPEMARDPYQPYGDELAAFWHSVASRHEGEA
jgi:hypothetical protein